MTDLVFLGDSVTDCQRKRAERFEQTPAGLGHGWVHYVARELLAGSEQTSVWNRGYSGCLTAGLMTQDRWWPQRNGHNVQAGLASLMIGINDIWHPFWKQTPHRLEHALTAYYELVATIQARSAQVVLCEPVALPCGDVQQAWWPLLKTLTEGQAAIARELNCIWVPLQDAMKTRAEGHFADYLYDGVHPTDSGHRWLSQQWLTAVTRAGLVPHRQHPDGSLFRR